jgi:hypothetical protein
MYETELAQFAAEDAAAAAVASARNAYNAFQAELATVEARTGFYLADEIIDDENALEAGDELATWQVKLQSAQMAAGERAAAEGADINALLGRVVY